MITEEQRKTRQAGIGGSDAPAILGISPYATPLELWQQKTGQAPAPDLSDSEPVHWGNVLEDVIAREFSRRTGWTLRNVNRTLQHTRYPFILGHIDRRVTGRHELVEIKTVRGLGDEPRPDHVAQVRHYMAVLGFHAAHLVYLVAGQRLVHHVVERDPQAEALLLDAELEFWEHVQTRTPPAPRSVGDMRILWPLDTGEAVQADQEAQGAVDRLREVQHQRKALEAEEKALQARIMGTMGEASALLDARGRTLVTWKAAKPSQVLDRKRLENDHPDLVSAYLDEKPGPRRFMVKEVAA